MQLQTNDTPNHRPASTRIIRRKVRNPAADEWNRRVGHKIRALRVLAGLSQQKLGEKIGVTFQQMQKYERGSNRVSVGALVVIAQALGTTPSIFFGDDPMPQTTSRATLELVRNFEALRPRAREAIQRFIRDLSRH